MAINYLTVFFATLLIGMECRSMIFSNLNQVVEGSENHEESEENLVSDVSASKDFDYMVNLTNENQEFVDQSSKDFPRDLNRLITSQNLSLEKFFTEFIARAMNITDREETTAQTLKQLKLILEALSSGIQIERSSINRANDIGKTESTLHEGNKNFILIGGNNWLDDLQDFLDEQYIDAESSEDNENYVKSTGFEDSSKSYSSDDENSEEIEDDSSDQHELEQLDDTVTEFHNDISGIRKYFGTLCRKHRTAL